MLVALLTSPVVAGWLYGSAAALRGLMVLILGLPAIIVLSAYWIVPSVFQLQDAALTQLSAISSWSWTEVRATVRNGFWLNTAWPWAYPDYFPFAASYDALPLSVLRFAPALVAFGALTIRYSRDTKSVRSSLNGGLRVSVLAASVALVLIFLGTGTNPPGNVLFDGLYTLPFGWLLREPGRFLVVADLMFAVLVAITADRLLQFDWLRGHIRNWRRPTLRGVMALPIILAITLPGLPLITGSIVQESTPVRATHVQLPSYWTEMTSFADGLPLRGGVLVLPPDDFYQMPYRWGYYGSDNFISQLMSRPFLIPSSQAYFPASSQLLKVEDLAARTLLTGDWQLEDHLLRVLDTPLVLVRGDLAPELYGRTLQSPTALVDALQHSPSFDLVHTSGPLSLFKLRGAPQQKTEIAPYFATVNTSTPDLRVLSRLPDQTALVSGPPRPGAPSLEELPPVLDWPLASNEVTWDFVEKPGWTYDLIRVDSEKPIQPIDTLMATRLSPIHVTRVPGERGATNLEIGVAAANDLTNSSFEKGQWSPVGDCNRALGAATAASPGWRCGRDRRP